MITQLIVYNSDAPLLRSRLLDNMVSVYCLDLSIAIQLPTRRQARDESVVAVSDFNDQTMGGRVGTGILSIRTSYQLLSNPATHQRNQHFRSMKISPVNSKAHGYLGRSGE